MANLAAPSLGSGYQRWRGSGLRRPGDPSPRLWGDFLQYLEYNPLSRRLSFASPICPQFLAQCQVHTRCTLWVLRW
jgi:hypothetical protein